MFGFEVWCRISCQIDGATVIDGSTVMFTSSNARTSRRLRPHWTLPTEVLMLVACRHKMHPRTVLRLLLRRHSF